MFNSQQRTNDKNELIFTVHGWTIEMNGEPAFKCNMILDITFYWEQNRKLVILNPHKCRTGGAKTIKTQHLISAEFSDMNETWLRV